MYSQLRENASGQQLKGEVLEIAELLLQYTDVKVKLLL